MFSNFTNFKDYFLNLRRTLSNFYEIQMKNSKLYSRERKKMRIKLDEMMHTPRENINYPIVYLPLPGNNLLTTEK